MSLWVGSGRVQEFRKISGSGRVTLLPGRVGSQNLDPRATLSCLVAAKSQHKVNTTIADTYPINSMASFSAIYFDRNLDLDLPLEITCFLRNELTYEVQIWHAGML